MLELLLSLLKNPYVLVGFIALVLFIVGLALPDTSKNADGSINDNKSTKTSLIAVGVVIGVIDAAVYFYMQKRKSSQVVPLYYF